MAKSKEDADTMAEDKSKPGTKKSQPTIDGLDPSGGQADAKYPINIFGSDFDTKKPAVKFATGIEVDEVIPQHTGHLVVKVTVDKDAAGDKAEGKLYPVRVTNPDGGYVTKDEAFRVLAA